MATKTVRVHSNFIKTLIALDSANALGPVQFFSLLNELSDAEIPFLNLFDFRGSEEKLVRQLNQSEGKPRTFAKAVTLIGLYPRTAIEIVATKFRGNPEVIADWVKAVFGAHALMARIVAQGPEKSEWQAVARAANIGYDEAVELIRDANLLFGLIGRDLEWMRYMRINTAESLLELIPYRPSRVVSAARLPFTAWRLTITARWGTVKDLVDLLLSAQPDYALFAYGHFVKNENVFAGNPQEEKRYLYNALASYPEKSVLALLKEHGDRIEQLFEDTTPLYEKMLRNFSQIGRGELLLLSFIPQTLRERYFLDVAEPHLVKIVGQYFADREELQKALFPTLSVPQKIEAGKLWKGVPSEWLVSEFNALLEMQDDKLIYEAGASWDRLPKTLLMKSVERLQSMTYIRMAIKDWGIDDYAIQRRNFLVMHGDNAYIAGKEFKKLTPEDRALVFRRLRGFAAYRAGQEWQGLTPEMLREAFLKLRLSGKGLYLAGKEWKNAISNDDRRKVFRQWKALKDFLPQAGAEWEGLRLEDKVDVFRELNKDMLIYRAAKRWELPEEEVIAKEPLLSFENRATLCEKYPKLIDGVLRDAEKQEAKGIITAWRRLEKHRDTLLPILLRGSDETILQCLAPYGEPKDYTPPPSLRSAFMERIMRSEKLAFVFGAADWLSAEESAALWTILRDPEMRRTALSRWKVFEELEGESLVRFIGNPIQAAIHLQLQYPNQKKELSQMVRRMLGDPELEQQEDKPQQLGLSFF